MRSSLLVSIVLCLARQSTAILESYTVLPVGWSLLENLANQPNPQWTTTRRVWGTVPQGCWTQVQNYGTCTPADVYVYDIKYTDVRPYTSLIV
jgi:hypothetical protein